jgi:isovaleryl-CoA dehydrogenase
MFMASMTFDLGEDVNALREMVHRWAQERVKPLAAEIDRTNAFPQRAVARDGRAGPSGHHRGRGVWRRGDGLPCPYRRGGGDQPRLGLVGLSYGAHSNLCVNQIKLNGTPEQKAKYLPG